MQQQLIQVKNKIVKKTFVPDQELLILAEKIRRLKSRQITGRFTRTEVTPILTGTGIYYSPRIKKNERCVLGALMVEFYGVNDSHRDINIALNNMHILCKYEYNIVDDGYKSTSIGVEISFPRKIDDVDLASKLVRMNDTGRTFSEIADWVEIEAYKMGKFI
jgi:hypothetical protein